MITLTPELSQYFTLQNETLISINEEFRWEIGDSSKTDFNPHIKLSRWGDTEFSIDLPKAVFPGTETIGSTQEKASWRKGDFETRFYRKAPIYSHESGRMEFEIVLHSNPGNNTFNLPFNHTNCIFNKQPPTILGVAVADEVNGSYAVYRADGKKNNQFTTGKICHIYRPHIVDSLGAGAWCDILITPGILKITVPAGYLDTATYPVFLDPTFGDTGVGATPAAVDDVVAAEVFTLSEAGSVTKLTVYTDVSITGSRSIIGAVYNSTGATKQGSDSSESTSTNTPGWHDLTFGTPIALSAADYVLGVAHQAGAGDHRIYVDSEGAATNKDYAHTYDSTMPADISTGADDDVSLSLYATYTVGSPTSNIHGPLYGPLGGVI